MAGLLSNLFGGGGGAQARHPCFSFETFQTLCSRLQKLTDLDGSRDSMEEPMVEVIRQMAEALIWGEQTGYEPNFFDYFCEQNILENFVRLLGMERVPKGVKVQIVQTLSMLVQNIRRDTSLYYLFSNNHVNHLISTPFDWCEEELLGYYISFLKSLALRLNPDTIQFFFHLRSGELQFPLYLEAVRFFGHRDQMVRTSIRNLTLQVYKVSDDKMQAFILERSWRTYFVHLGCHLRELWFKLESCRDRGSPGDCRQSLQEVDEEQSDLLMYISDVLTLGRTELRDALAERILQYAIFPLLVGSLLVAESGEKTAGVKGEHLSPEVALFLLSQVLDIFRTIPCIITPLVVVLLLHRPPTVLLEACLRSPPPCPATYKETSSDVSGPPPGHGDVGPLDDDGPADPGGGLTYLHLAEAAIEGEQVVCEKDDAPRIRLLDQLESPNDACVLLVVGLLRMCLGLEHFLPAGLIRRVGLLRPVAEASGSVDESQDAELLQLLLRTLGRHSSLRIVALQVLVDLVARMVAVPSSEGVVACSDEAWEATKAALRTAAVHVRSYLQAASSADWFLDVFEEEWEAQGEPSGVEKVCSNVFCLLRPVSGLSSLPGWTAEWSPHCTSDMQHAAKVTRCFLLLRRLCQTLRKEEEEEEAAAEAAAASPGSAGSDPAAASGLAAVPGNPLSPRLRETHRSPLFVPEEVADGFEEKHSIELGRLDRVVCAVAPSEGQSHYLILHKFLMLLIKPDLVTAGWAVVRTMAPLRAVEPHVDADDPQTLRLAIRLPRALPWPGGLRPYDPATVGEDCDFFRRLADDHRGSTLYAVTLKFMDNMRCNYACSHLRKRRQEVRNELKRRAEEFVEGFC